MQIYRFSRLGKGITSIVITAENKKNWLRMTQTQLCFPLILFLLLMVVNGQLSSEKIISEFQLTVPFKQGFFQPHVIVDTSSEDRKIIAQYTIPVQQACWWMQASVPPINSQRFENHILSYDYVVKIAEYPTNIDYSFLNPFQHMTHVRYSVERAVLTIFTINLRSSLVTSYSEVSWKDKRFGGTVKRSGFVSDSTALYIARIFHDVITISKIDMLNHPSLINQMPIKVVSGVDNLFLVKTSKEKDMVLVYQTKGKDIWAMHINSDTLRPIDTLFIASNSTLLTGVNDQLVWLNAIGVFYKAGPDDSLNCTMISKPSNQRLRIDGVGSFGSYIASPLKIETYALTDKRAVAYVAYKNSTIERSITKFSKTNSTWSEIDVTYRSPEVFLFPISDREIVAITQQSIRVFVDRVEVAMASLYNQRLTENIRSAVEFNDRFFLLTETGKFPYSSMMPLLTYIISELIQLSLKNNFKSDVQYIQKFPGIMVHSGHFVTINSDTQADIIYLTAHVQDDFVAIKYDVFNRRAVSTIQFAEKPAIDPDFSFVYDTDKLAVVQQGELKIIDFISNSWRVVPNDCVSKNLKHSITIEKSRILMLGPHNICDVYLGTDIPSKIDIATNYSINFNFTFVFQKSLVFGIMADTQSTYVVKIPLSDLEKNSKVLQAIPKSHAKVKGIVKSGAKFNPGLAVLFIVPSSPDTISEINSNQIRLSTMRNVRLFRRNLPLSADYMFALTENQQRDGRMLIGTFDGRAMVVDPHFVWTTATIILVTSVIALLTCLGLCLFCVFPPLIYLNEKSRRRTKVMDQLNIKLLEYEKPIDPNLSFVRNPMNKSYIIPFESLKFHKRLSEGSSGVIYVGTWNRTKVAIKQMKTINDESKVMQEISIMSSIRHPNIIMFCGVTVDNNDNKFIITQYAPKGSLDNVIYQRGMARNQVLTFQEKMSILSGVARGANYLHAMYPPVIHRDLKPQNILIDKDMTPKICDFGLSKFRVDEQMTGATLGTKEYIAPELLMQTSNYGTKCDVYSFGIIMYELFFNQRPYTPLDLEEDFEYVQENMFMFGFKVISGERPVIPFNLNKEQDMEPWYNRCNKPGTSFNPEAIRLYFELCQRCWAKDPDHRPSFEQVCEKLEEIICLFDESDQ